ncbi:MAG: beta-N-acetylhexosaminidase [Anaerolineae bacterium]
MTPIETFSLIPYPQSVTAGAGHFSLTPHTAIYASMAVEDAAETFAALLRQQTALPLPVRPLSDGAAQAQHLNLILLPEAEDAGAESYHLRVTPDQMEIRAGSAAGLFYGMQTLRQLLPPTPQPDAALTIPAVTIDDAPRFRWRGLHLDVGRHFFPIAFVKKFIDALAAHKYNVFHWHLTEDQGWRIEIKQYPRLTEVGSRRSATPIPADRTKPDGVPYGGFYTQEEIREVVAYAAQRFITVVPEIEMPGHALAALASYPELGCVGHGYQVGTTWGILEDVFCAGNEDTFTFLQNVLTEVLDLFPSEYIHIGGDECPKVRWEHCPKCQAAIKREGLKDEHELQSYFIRRMEAFLNQQGRRLVGWDEILEGGLAPNATVMSWRGTEGGIAAAAAGHDVIMSPTTTVYLDYYQSEDTDNEPPAIGGYIPIEHVYAFNPVDGVPADKVSHVLGGQGNIWSEYMPTGAQVEYMVYPRACALAEALWTAPASRSFDDFAHRLTGHLPRLAALGLNYRTPRP